MATEHETPSPDVMEVWREAYKACDGLSEDAGDQASANVIAEAKARWESEAFEKAAKVVDDYEIDWSEGLAVNVSNIVRLLHDLKEDGK